MKKKKMSSVYYKIFALILYFSKDGTDWLLRFPYISQSVSIQAQIEAKRDLPKITALTVNYLIED